MKNDFILFQAGLFLRIGWLHKDQSVPLATPERGTPQCGLQTRTC
jgi:hypothetical protein